MAGDNPGVQSPNFEIIDDPPPLSLDEFTERYGDPSQCIHPEENRDEAVELLSSLGEAYEVHLGLPEAVITGGHGALKAFGAPNEPHVFTTDRFILNKRGAGEPAQTLVDETDLRVLFMHARWNGDTWVPKDPALQTKGVTIPTLLSAFEKETGLPVDVVWACQAGTGPTPHKLETDTGHPYIYPVIELAVGRVELEWGYLTTYLEEGLGDVSSKIEYQEWLEWRHAQSHSTTPDRTQW